MSGEYDTLASYAEPMEVISSLLRSMLKARGSTRFLCADFSAIEGWVVSWLAGQETMMSYKDMASRIYNIPVEEIGDESDERHVGKTAVLGAGFGMGGPKFKDTVYDWTGIRISDEMADYVIKGVYRVENKQIVDLWYELERAALAAVRSPGMKVACGTHSCITYRVKGPYLWCVLPSGRALCYPLPLIEDRLTPWGFMKPAVVISTTNSVTRKWERRSLYGGLQTENIVQAIARDVMAEAMLRVEQAGYPIVLTVHDEVLAEAQTGTLDAFCEIMRVTPEWAPGLHVGVKGWEGERYRK